MNVHSLGFIGGGRISRFLLQALKQKNALPETVLVSDPNDQMIDKIRIIDNARIQCVDKSTDVLDVDILFLAVHPPVVNDVAAEISGKIPADTIVVSFMPVLSIEKLSGMLGGVKKLVRMIPNAPSIRHKGYNPMVCSDAIPEDEKQQLHQLFGNWGEAPEVDERKLEAYAIVTAMGPTYFWFQWLKLYELGQQFGMNDAELMKSLPAMLHGAIETLFESELKPEEVLDLIPVCPLKEDEPTIQHIFDTKLKGLHAKLTPR